MSGATSRLAIGYPSNSDALTSFPALMKTSMETLDEAHLRGVKFAPWSFAAGVGSVTIPSGSAFANSSTILFKDLQSPAASTARFSVAPIIVVSPFNSTLYSVGLLSADNLGFVVQARTISGATGGATVQFRFIALQMLQTAAQG